MKRNKSFDGSSVLYLIATPIGNLKEFTPRALDIINEADLVAAEDTRNTYSLLANFGIKKPLFSLREHNEKEAAMHIIKSINEGKKVVYVSCDPETLARDIKLLSEKYDIKIIQPVDMFPMTFHVETVLGLILRK